MSLCLHRLRGVLGVGLDRLGRVLGGLLEVLGAPRRRAPWLTPTTLCALSAELAAADSRAGCTWATACSSRRVVGRRLPASAPTPKAMSPAASGLPCVWDWMACGADVTTSPTVEMRRAADRGLRRRRRVPCVVSSGGVLGAHDGVARPTERLAHCDPSPLDHAPRAHRDHRSPPGPGSSVLTLLLQVVPQVLCCLAHSTSSLIASMVCSATGVADVICCLPFSTSTAATAA